MVWRGQHMELQQRYACESLLLYVACMLLYNYCVLLCVVCDFIVCSIFFSFK
jgi:hypothetical protein